MSAPMDYAGSSVSYSVTLPDGSKKTISTVRAVSVAVLFADGSVIFCRDYNVARQRIQSLSKARGGSGTILKLD